MGSVLAGRMMLEVVLHSLKKRGGWGRRSPPFANRLPACGVEKVHMAAVSASPGVGGKAAPPFANRLPARWYLNWSITVADDAMFLKESLHGVKKSGGAAPPPICTHDVFITGSERGHMGSVFAGRMILDMALYSLKKARGLGRTSPPQFANRLPA